MDDLDRLLAETMKDAAGRAPSDDGLLGTVHARSRRIQRRRVATGLSAAAAVVILGVPSAFVLATRPAPVAPPAEPAPAASSSPAGTPPPSPSSSPSAGTASSAPPSAPPPPSSPSAPGSAVTLADGWTAPAFPYTLPGGARRAPVASMDRGNLIAFFETTEPERHSDVTITVSAGKPSFTGPAASADRQVRGHAGTLRTVDARPAKQLTLSWQESPSRWVQLATDDTYSPDEVVALADSLVVEPVPVLPPFELAYSPSGLATDTVSASRMTFRAPGGGVGLSAVLRDRRPLGGIDRKVSGYDAALTRESGSVTLAIDVTDWNATLEITVGAGLTISDADLLRFAGGVRILNRSDPE